VTETIEPVPAQIDQQQLAQELVEKARAEGVDLVGPGGLLSGLTKSVLETALEAEMSEHLGYDKHDPAGRNRANSRNGTRAKTVLTEIGPVEIDVPRDRDGTFEPAIVKKRQRRLDGIDQIVLSLTARGLTTGEIAAHVDEVYGAKVGKDTISRITDKVVEEMAEWRTRPLDRVYPVVFVDAIVVKVRDGQVVNRPVYVVIGVRQRRARHPRPVGRRRQRGREVLARRVDRDQEPRRRGRLHGRLRRPQGPTRVDHHHLVAGHGAGVHPAPDPQLFPLRQSQGLGRAGPRSAAGLHGGQRRARRRPLRRTGRQVGCPLPGDHALALGLGGVHSVPGLRRRDTQDHCSTNAIESLNARYRRAVRARGHFPTDQAALKCIYLVTRSLDPTGRGRARWAIRWKPALNAFAITFAGRIVPSSTN
jgi:putative transposase